MKFKRYIVSIGIATLVAVSVFSCIKIDDQAVNNGKLEKFTVEQYCHMLKEISDMGINRYYDRLAGREYSEVKDVFAEFEKDREKIFKKYNMTAKELQLWKKGKFFKINEYLEKNPDTAYNVSEKQKAFNETVARLVYAQLKEKEDSR